jgi:subtilisin family serine protease
MATPHVTGVLALVWGLRPEWNDHQVISQVMSTVTKVSSLAGKTASGGIVNAAAAVHVPPRTTSTTTGAKSATASLSWTTTPVSPLAPVGLAEVSVDHSLAMTLLASRLAEPSPVGSLGTVSPFRQGWPELRTTGDDFLTSGVLGRRRQEEQGTNERTNERLID